MINTIQKRILAALTIALLPGLLDVASAADPAATSNKPSSAAVPNKGASTSASVEKSKNNPAPKSAPSKSATQTTTKAATGKPASAPAKAVPKTTAKTATASVKKATTVGKSGKAAVSAHTTTQPLSSSIITVNADGTPKWLDVKSAQAAAKAKHKMIIADFFTDWCSWCKVLDKKTLSDPTVQTYLAKNFVCMKVDAQDGGAGEQLARQFDVQGFPTTMIFQYNGRKLTSFDGFREPADYLAAIKSGLGTQAP